MKDTASITARNMVAMFRKGILAGAAKKKTDARITAQQNDLLRCNQIRNCKMFMFNTKSHYERRWFNLVHHQIFKGKDVRICRSWVCAAWLAL